MSSRRLSKTIIAIAAVAITVVWLIAWIITPPSDLPRVPPGLRSGKQAAFQSLIAAHGSGTKRNGNELLRISAFSDPGVARQYFVSESGEEHDARKVWNFATQDTVIRQLTPADIQQITKAASQLPKSDADPIVKHLVVVSFWEGTKWVTRSYDSESLPAEMITIFEVIHQREDRSVELFERQLKKNSPATSTIVQ